MPELCYQCDGEGFAPMVNGRGGGNCPRCGGGGKERDLGPVSSPAKCPFCGKPVVGVWPCGYIHSLIKNDLLTDAAGTLYTALDGMVSACGDLYKSGRLDASAWLTARAALAKARGEG